MFPLYEYSIFRQSFILLCFERKKQRETECCEVNSKCEMKKQGKEDRVHSQCDIMGKMWR